MSNWKIEDFDRVLVVEGYSDQTFLAEVLEYVGKHGSVFIKHFNGKGDLLIELETLLSPMLLAEKTHIGVIVDSDENGPGTFTKFQQGLAKITGQTVPTHAAWTNGSPQIGLFVAPDGVSKGEIESLVWGAWSANPSNSVMRGCIEQFRDCMAAAGFTAQSREKGLISSLLAIRNDEDPRLGPGARQRGIFDFNAPEFEQLRTFLSSF